MSRLQRKLSPFFSATLTHPRTREARRRLAELGRRVRGAPHRVLYFHQVDDPYGSSRRSCGGARRVARR